MSCFTLDIKSPSVPSADKFSFLFQNKHLKTMSTSVLQACELNEQKLPKFTLIQETCGADGSFLIISILGQCLKFQQNGVILVCLHHTSQHYSNAGVRLGFNMNMAKDKGRIHLIEPLVDIGTNPLTSTYLTSSKGEVLQSLLTEIKENTEKQLESKENATIIIDNIATFVNLGFGANLILRFCHQLVSYSESSDRISLILKVNISNLNEEIISSLEDYANSNILISKLKSGEFQEVDGRITYKKRIDNFKHASKSILFKINDRNVKVFQPGEVGIKA